MNGENNKYKTKLEPVFLNSLYQNENFCVGKVEIDNKELIARAFEQAVLKSQFTNNGNQNNQQRTGEQKFQKQLQGIISEMIVEDYLNRVFKKESGVVIRYDDVRTDDFKSPKNEFDIKLKFKEKEFEIEVRSSLSYRTEMSYETLEYFDVLGPYVNKVKKNENYNDFYIRPILQLKNPDRNINIKNIDIMKGILNNEFDFYITGGCTKKMMSENSLIKSMGQNNTQYEHVPVLKSLNIKDLTNILRLTKIENTPKSTLEKKQEQVINSRNNIKINK